MVDFTTLHPFDFDRNLINFLVEEVYKREPGLAKKLNKAGIAPLHVAVATGHQEASEYLIAHTPCSPALIVSAKGNTALHCACQNNQEAIAEYLITQSTPDFLTARNEKGFLPIHFSATQGNIRLVKLLSEYMERIGVSGNSKGGPGNSWTPLHCAAEAGHVEVAKYYCSQPKINFSPQHYNWTDTIFKLVKVANFNPLHIAAINGRESVMKYLLQSGRFWPMMLCRDFGCSNSLHLAAYHGHLNCCQLLIDDYNLSPLDATDSGFTAIDLAAAAGNLAIVKYMTETKGYSSFGAVTPFEVAIYYGKVEVISWFLSTGRFQPQTTALDFVHILDESLMG